MLPYVGVLIVLCVLYLIAMHTIGMSGKVGKAVVTIVFSVFAFGLTYKVMEYFNVLDTVTWLLLWIEFPVFLVEFWYIDEIANRLVDISPRRRQVFDNIIHRVKKPTSKPSQWVRTGV